MGRYENMEYIYLDWNVIKYTMCPRKDEHQRDDVYFTAMIFDLKKRGKYIVPYSEAHIKDRSNHYVSDYYDSVRADMSFLSRLCDSICLYILDDKICMKTKPAIKLFTEYINREPPQISYEELHKNTTALSIDISKLAPKSPLYNIAYRNLGEISREDMTAYLVNLFGKVFDDVDTYKNIRQFLPRVNIDSEDMNYHKENNEYASRLYDCLSPFFSSFQYDEPTLMNKWKNICEKYFSLNGKGMSKKDFLMNSYVLLDLHPLFSEKLKKRKNTLDNIGRDGLHIYYASHAKFFVSEDEMTRRKCRFLYRAFRIPTKVVSEKEFLHYHAFGTKRILYV